MIDTLTNRKFEQSRNKMSKRTITLLLIGIIIIAAGARFYGLDRQSIWYDEAVEEQDFQVLLNVIFDENYHGTPDVTPPLNPFFVYLATKISPGSDFALRMPALIFGLISVPLLFLLGWRLFNEKVGLLAAYLLAISPFHIWYSQDARMYALQWMLVIISLIFFIKTLENPTFKNFFFYIISSEAGLYTHQFFVFLSFSLALYVLINWKMYRSQSFKWLGSYFVLVLLYLPWLIYSLTSLFHKASGAPIKPLSLKVLLYTIYAYSAGFSIGPSLEELHMDQSLSIIMPYIIVIGLIMIVYCTLFMLGLLSVRKYSSKFLLLLLTFIVPIVGVFVLSTVKPSIAYNVRYTAIAFIAFLLFIAKGIEYLYSLKPGTSGVALAVCVILSVTGTSVYSYYNYQFDNRYHKDDIRGAVAYLEEEKKADDVILILGCPGKVFERYSEGTIKCKRYFNNSINNIELFNAEMQRIAGGRKRLWLVTINEWDLYVKKASYHAREWLNSNYEEIPRLRKGIREIANINIYCYDLTKKHSDGEKH